MQENTRERLSLTDEQTERFCAAAGLTKQELTRLLELMQSATRTELLLMLAFMEGVKLGAKPENMQEAKSARGAERNGERAAKRAAVVIVRRAKGAARGGLNNARK